MIRKVINDLCFRIIFLSLIWKLLFLNNFWQININLALQNISYHTFFLHWYDVDPDVHLLATSESNCLSITYWWSEKCNILNSLISISNLMHFQGKSHIYVLSNNPCIGSQPTKMKVIPFFPDYMYCVLPSDANQHGSLYKW